MCVCVPFKTHKAKMPVDNTQMEMLKQKPHEISSAMTTLQTGNTATGYESSNSKTA